MLGREVCSILRINDAIGGADALLRSDLGSIGGGGKGPPKQGFRPLRVPERAIVVWRKVK